jgi:hypothetical protein
METTFDVRVWKLQAYKGKRSTTYTVRWSVAGREHRKTYSTQGLADAFRSELVSATRRGEAFNEVISCAQQSRG